MALSVQDKIYGYIAYSGIKLPDGTSLRFNNTQEVANYVAANGEFPAGATVGGQPYSQVITDYQNADAAQKTAGSKTATDAVANERSLAPGESIATTEQNTGTSVPKGAASLTAQENKNIDPYNPNSWDSEGAPVPYTPNPAQQATLKKIANKEDGTVKKPTSTNAGSSITYQVTPNQLHNYPGYTYGLTLHALSNKHYAEMLNNPKKFTVTKTLISSASRFHDTRSEFFTDDFYFDDFKMSTVIGLNAQTRASNAIQLNFTIIEPYGMTLINRLLDFSAVTLQVENYLQIPYLLQLDFYGYNNSGNQEALTQFTKYIPIKLINMKIKAGVRGSEYRIDAVPFSQQANFSTTQSVPVQVEIIAKTVKDFFNNLGVESATNTQATQIVERRVISNQIANNQSPELDPSAFAQPKPPTAQPVTPPPAVGQFAEGSGGAAFGNPGLARQGQKAGVKQETPTTTTAPAPVTDDILKSSNGFASAYNAWFNALETYGQGIDKGCADQILFVVQEGKDIGVSGAPALGSAAVSIPKKVDATKSPMTPDTKDGKNIAERANDPKLSASTPSLPIDQINTGTFSINAGTSIQSVIDTVITNSTYIIDQLTNPETEEANPDARSSAENLSSALKQEQVFWYKVVPKVEIGKFDTVRQTWAKKITYYIKPYIYYNMRDQRAAISTLPGPVKDYEFLYTGKNLDVINFDMDFNALFFTAVTVNNNAKEVSGKTPGSTNVTEDTKNSKSGNQSGYYKPLANQSEPIITTNSTTGGAIKDSNKQNAQSFKDSVYSQLGGDMLQLKLQIIGDPDFIKQDEILIPPSYKGYTPGKQTVTDDKGSSLVMDTGAIYCRVTFRTPTDIDDSTGGIRYYGKKNSSAFSGLYKIIQVHSEFRQGKFTQTLELVREPNQPEDNKTAPGNTPPRTDKAVTDASNKATVSKSPKVSGNSVNDIKTIPVIPANVPVVTENTPPGPTIDVKTAENPGSLYDEPNYWDKPGPTEKDLQGITESGPTVPIGDNSIVTGEPIIGYTV